MDSHIHIHRHIGMYNILGRLANSPSLDIHPLAPRLAWLYKYAQQVQAVVLVQYSGDDAQLQIPVVHVDNGHGSHHDNHDNRHGNYGQFRNIAHARDNIHHNSLDDPVSPGLTQVAGPASTFASPFDAFVHSASSSSHQNLLC